jgi:hypothetical protein
MGTSIQRFILQQLSLTASGAYATHIPSETTLQQNIVAEYWAKQLASAAQQTFFVSVWRAGYYFHWAVARAALTYTQTRDSAGFSSMVTGALRGLQEQLGEIGAASASFNEQQEVQPRDEQQARRIECMVQCCQHFANDSMGMWAAFLNDGTWRRLMTWAVRGLDEALARDVPDHTQQVTAAQLSASSGISELLCTWYLDARMSPEERAQAVKDAIAELTAQWGYRDITELICQMNAADAAEYPAEHREEQAYLCVLQTPEGGPVYCRSSRRLFKELQAARATNTPYERCPAPDPCQHMWMVAGNFDLEDDEYAGGGA